MAFSGSRFLIAVFLIAIGGGVCFQWFSQGGSAPQVPPRTLPERSGSGALRRSRNAPNTSPKETFCLKENLHLPPYLDSGDPQALNFVG